MESIVCSIYIYICMYNHLAMFFKFFPPFVSCWHVIKYIKKNALNSAGKGEGPRRSWKRRTAKSAPTQWWVHGSPARSFFPFSMVELKFRSPWLKWNGPQSSNGQTPHGEDVHFTFVKYKWPRKSLPSRRSKLLGLRDGWLIRFCSITMGIDGSPLSFPPPYRRRWPVAPLHIFIYTYFQFIYKYNFCIHIFLNLSFYLKYKGSRQWKIKDILKFWWSQYKNIN